MSVRERESKPFRARESETLQPGSLWVWDFRVWQCFETPRRHRQGVTVQEWFPGIWCWKITHRDDALWLGCSGRGVNDSNAQAAVASYRAWE